jgi:hypothetical protein
MLERDYWPCPFCENGIIEVLIRPASYKIHKVITGKGGRGNIRRNVKEEVVILSEKCNICGKTREEIESCLKKEGVI